MKAIGLVPLALLAACRGGALAPAPPGDADTDAGKVADGGGADTDAGEVADGGGATPDVAPDGGPPSLYQPAPATGCASVHLVVDGSFVYWTDEANGAVTRAPTAGGASSPIAVGEDRPTWLAVSGGRVFWTAGGPGPSPTGNPSRPTLGRSIRVGSLAGGDAKVVATVPGGVYGAAATDDGGAVYFSTGNEIQRVSSDGGTPSLVATFIDGSTPRGLALSGTTLVALDDIDGFVVLVDLTAAGPISCGQRDPMTGAWSGGPCRRLQNDNGSLLSGTVLVHGSTLYWADGDQIRGGDLSTSLVATGIPADASYVNALCLGGDRVFFASDDHTIDDPAPDVPPAGAGLIEAAAPDPDAANVVLARGQRRTQSIAADGDRVFWATIDCAIWSAAR